ncbi:hypothetical protein FACS1894137_12070 [Spirochaetia bacterium]|nr:hypothetical protein FACS1894137_12070 [Spirochaetia bacterium]
MKKRLFLAGKRGTAVLLFTVLLSGCDLFNKPLEPFIKDQTGVVRITDTDERSVGISPAGEFTVPVALDNRQGYTLWVTILNKGVPVDPAKIWVDNPVTEDQLVIHFKGAAAGETFNITLKLRIEGSNRILDDLELPLITCTSSDKESSGGGGTGGKEITSFSLDGTAASISPGNIELSPPSTGSIAGSETPVLTVSPGADYSPKEPWGSDLTKTYTVTAADGTSQTYTVTMKAVAYGAGADTYYPSLQKAITESTTGTSGSLDTITLYENINITDATRITITNGKHVKLIAGNGVRTISRGESGFGSLFTVNTGGSLELGGDAALTIDGKKGSPDNYAANAALITVNTGGTLNMSSDATLKDNNNDDTSAAGGGVSSSGTFTMSGGSITGNTATNGGGVSSSDTFTMSGGSITGNTATNGGGVSSSGTFTMSASSITGNTATNGGGVSSSGTFTMNSGSITNNTATTNGGGVYMGGGNFNMNGGSFITNNAATTRGGGIYMTGTTARFIMSGGHISGNAAASHEGKSLYRTDTPGWAENAKYGTPLSTINIMNGTSQKNTDFDLPYYNSGSIAEAPSF